MIEMKIGNLQYGYMVHTSTILSNVQTIILRGIIYKRGFASIHGTCIKMHYRQTYTAEIQNNRGKMFSKWHIVDRCRFLLEIRIFMKNHTNLFPLHLYGSETTACTWEPQLSRLWSVLPNTPVINCSDVRNLIISKKNYSYSRHDSFN